MKTFNKFKKILLASAFITASIITSISINAQDYKPYFGNANWQFNAPISNSFTNRASGWGANLEGGYYIMPKIGLGAFVSYSTNHKYIPTETLMPKANSALTTNQQRSLFQIPFGINVRYRINPDNTMLDPYVAIKLGTEYAQLSSYISTYQLSDDSWGFYMSPEIGTNIWLSEDKNFGFNASLYYSFSTNKGHVLDGHVNQLNNIGFRLGVAF